jgi:thioredoxin-dependent peroxiredoxin
MLAVGEAAPDFEALDCQKRPVRLSAFRGRRVVVFFFPKAFTPICMEEVRHFRDNQARIRALGAELIGVSVDKPEVQCDFAKSENLDFTLLGDADRTISEKFGVLWPVVRIDRRVTFLISPQGVVEEIIEHERQAWKHVDGIVTALERRASSPAAP